MQYIAQSFSRLEKNCDQKQHFSKRKKRGKLARLEIVFFIQLARLEIVFFTRSADFFSRCIVYRIFLSPLSAEGPKMM